MTSFHNWNSTPGVEVFPGDMVWNVTGEQLQIIRACMAPGTDFGLHSHHQEQIICVLEGELEFTVGDQTKRVGPGEVIHAPSGVIHGGRVVSDTPVVTIEGFSPPRANFTENHSMDFEAPR